MKSIVCPISKAKVNKAVARLTGAFVVLAVAAYAITDFLPIILFLAIDFYIRAYTDRQFSPLSYLACQIIKALKSKPVWIDKAPKVFAARVGLIFSVTVTLLHFASPIAALSVAGILGFFAFLESAFSFCVGCVVYTYVVLPLYQRKSWLSQ